MNAPTTLGAAPGGHDEEPGQVCMSCAASELADVSCPSCVRLLAFHHMTRMYIRNAQAQAARDGCRRGVTISLVLSVVAAAGLLVLSGKVVVAALCATYVGTRILAFVWSSREFRDRHAQLCGIVGLPPDFEGMPIEAILAAARRAQVMRIRPPVE